MNIREFSKTLLTEVTSFDLFESLFTTS